LAASTLAMFVSVDGTRVVQFSAPGLQAFEQAFGRVG
jgi:hypothetical protein